MTRIAFHREGKEPVTFHDLAVLGINEFLDYLERCKSLEFVSLVSDLFLFRDKDGKGSVKQSTASNGI